MSQQIDRRTFLGQAARGGAGIVILSGAASARAYRANEKVNVALVGVGGRGKWFVQTMPKLANVVAYADVSDKKATIAMRTLPKTPKYYDFRKMLDEKDKEIEAVVTATPDHIHAPVSAAAIKRGKGVYCEKPLTNSVRESRTVRALAKKHKVATEMGNQGTASAQYRRAVELIQDGVLGEIKQVLVWKDSGGPDRKEKPEGTAKIPPYLKWDLWLGPRPARPFHPRWMAWHGWREFGTCQLGNWASHTANLAFRALKIDALWTAPAGEKPRIVVEAKTSGINRLSFPKWEIIHWQIPARGKLPPITIEYLNGSRGPNMREYIEQQLGRKLDWGDAGEKRWADHAATLIVGTKGKMWSNGHNTTFSLMPAEAFKGVDTSGPKRLPRSRGHERDWLLAVKGGAEPLASFEYAGKLNEFLMLGNVATQFEGKLEFDPLSCKIVNNPKADAALDCEYKEGWSL